MSYGFTSLKKVIGLINFIGQINYFGLIGLQHSTVNPNITKRMDENEKDWDGLSTNGSHLYCSFQEMSFNSHMAPLRWCYTSQFLMSVTLLHYKLIACSMAHRAAISTFHCSSLLKVFENKFKNLQHHWPKLHWYVALTIISCNILLWTVAAIKVHLKASYVTRLKNSIKNLH